MHDNWRRYNILCTLCKIPIGCLPISGLVKILIFFWYEWTFERFCTLHTVFVCVNLAFFAFRQYHHLFSSLLLLTDFLKSLLRSIYLLETYHRNKIVDYLDLAFVPIYYPFHDWPFHSKVVKLMQILVFVASSEVHKWKVVTFHVRFIAKPECTGIIFNCFNFIAMQ